MSNKEEYFSIELKVTDKNDPLVKEFLSTITGGMASEDGFMAGAEIIACGWRDTAGDSTRVDAYEAYIEANHDDPEQVLEEFLEEEQENAHDR